MVLVPPEATNALFSTCCQLKLQVRLFEGRKHNILSQSFGPQPTMRHTPVTSTKGALGKKKSQFALPSFHLLLINILISKQENIMNFSVSLSRISKLHRNIVKFYFQANLGRHNINMSYCILLGYKCFYFFQVKFERILLIEVR